MRVSATIPWPGNEASPWIRAVRLLGSRAALDHGIDRLEVARVRRERQRDLAGPRRAHALGAEVVLDIAGAAFGIGDDRLEGALPLELPQDRLVRAAEDVRKDVQPAAVRHPEDDLVSAFLGRELERLVQHRDHHVEALDRELLLAQERTAEVALEALDLGQPFEEAPLLVVVERVPVAAGLDRRPQPDALLVIGDVFDLVRAGAAVDLPQPRQDVGEGLAGDVHAQEPRGDAPLERLGQLGLQPLGLEGGIAHRFGAEGVEPGREVAVHPNRLDERHRGGDAAEQLVVDRRLGCGRRRGGRRRRGRLGRWRGGCDGRVPVSVTKGLEQPGQPRERGDELAVAALEERSPLGRNRLGVLEVLLEERARKARVQAVNVLHAHIFVVATGFPAPRAPRRP